MPHIGVQQQNEREYVHACIEQSGAAFASQAVMWNRPNSTCLFVCYHILFYFLNTAENMQCASMTTSPFLYDLMAASRKKKERMTLTVLRKSGGGLRFPERPSCVQVRKIGDCTCVGVLPFVKFIAVTHSCYSNNLTCWSFKKKILMRAKYMDSL